MIHADDPHRLLVTGGTGQVGSAFRRLFPNAIAPRRSEFDLARPHRLRDRLEEIEPSVIVNCAAYTAVDAAESDEATAHTVNAEAVGAMASYAAERRVPFVTFSTDYVFAGTATEPYLESDATDPINAYGRTKLAGEAAALSAYPGALIVRTSWVISGTHPNFVATMLRLVRDRDLAVVDDQIGCPTVAADLAPAAWRAVTAGVTGILHLTNAGATTWYQLARTAVELGGFDPNRIRPCTTDEFPRPAPRPRYSVLGSERRGAIGLTLPPWQASLPGLVDELMAGGLVTDR